MNFFQKLAEKLFGMKRGDAFVHAATPVITPVYAAVKPVAQVVIDQAEHQAKIALLTEAAKQLIAHPQIPNAAASAAIDILGGLLGQIAIRL